MFRQKVVAIYQIISILNYYIPLPGCAHHALLLLGQWNLGDGVSHLIKVVMSPRMVAHTSERVPGCVSVTAPAFVKGPCLFNGVALGWNPGSLGCSPHQLCRIPFQRKLVEPGSGSNSSIVGALLLRQAKDCSEARGPTL